MISVLMVVSFISPMRYYFALAVTLQTEANPCLALTHGAAAQGASVLCTPLRSYYDIRFTVAQNFGAMCIIWVVLHIGSYAALLRSA